MITQEKRLGPPRVPEGRTHARIWKPDLTRLLFPWQVFQTDRTGMPGRVCPTMGANITGTAASTFCARKATPSITHQCGGPGPMPSKDSRQRDLKYGSRNFVPDRPRQTENVRCSLDHHLKRFKKGQDPQGVTSTNKKNPCPAWRAFERHSSPEDNPGENGLLKQMIQRMAERAPGAEMTDTCFHPAWVKCTRPVGPRRGLARRPIASILWSESQATVVWSLSS